MRYRMNLGLVTVVSVLTLILGCSSEPEGMGALEPQLFQGQNGNWIGERVGAGFQVENTADATGMVLLSAEAAPGSAGHRKANVDVTFADPTEYTNAGLLYAHALDHSFFYFFALRSDQTFTLYKANGLDDIQEVTSQPTDHARSDTNTLALEEDGDTVRLLINGNEVHSFSDKMGGEGGIGIGAWGTGRIVFDRFNLSPWTAIEASDDRPLAGGGGDAGEDSNRGRDNGRGQDGDEGQRLHLRMVEVLDRQGFERPVVAVRFLAPADWNVQGSVNWNVQFRCINQLAQVQVQATSPDGSLSFEMFPIYVAEWVDDPMEQQVKQQALQMGQRQCPLAPPFNAGGFIQNVFLPGFRGQGQIETIQPEPEAARAVARKVQRQFTAAGMGHQNIETDAASAILSYGDTEEKVLATTYTTVIQGPSMSAQARGSMAMRNQYFSLAEGVFSFRAPRGQLRNNEALFGTMVRSLQINPAWQTAVTSIQGQFTRNEIQQIGQASRAWARAAQESRDIQNESWEYSQRTRDELSTGWSEMMRGVATYADPESDARVELTDGYDNVWARNGNEFILSTDTSFNPNISFPGEDWDQLTRVSRP